jgi:hypothetical protein
MSKQGRKILNDLTGEQFGYLVAKRVVGTEKKRGALWLCECTNCNHEVERYRNSLVCAGNTLTCGCLFGFSSRVAKASGYPLPVVSRVFNNSGQVSLKVRDYIKTVAKELKQLKRWGRDADIALRRG